MAVCDAYGVCRVFAGQTAHQGSAVDGSLDVAGFQKPHAMRATADGRYVYVWDEGSPVRSYTTRTVSDAGDTGWVTGTAGGSTVGCIRCIDMAEREVTTMWLTAAPHEAYFEITDYDANTGAATITMNEGGGPVTGTWDGPAGSLDVDIDSTGSGAGYWAEIKQGANPWGTGSAGIGFGLLGFCYTDDGILYACLNDGNSIAISGNIYREPARPLDGESFVPQRLYPGVGVDWLHNPSFVRRGNIGTFSAGLALLAHRVSADGVTPVVRRVYFSIEGTGRGIECYEDPEAAFVRKGGAPAISSTTQIDHFAWEDPSVVDPNRKSFLWTSRAAGTLKRSSWTTAWETDRVTCDTIRTPPSGFAPIGVVGLGVGLALVSSTDRIYSVSGGRWEIGRIAW